MFIFIWSSSSSKLGHICQKRRSLGPVLANPLLYDDFKTSVSLKPPIEINFHIEFLLVGRTKIPRNDLCHMIKMSTLLIDKTIQITPSQAAKSTEKSNMQ